MPSFITVYIRGANGNQANVSATGKLEVDSTQTPASLSGLNVRVDPESISGLRTNVNNFADAKGALSGLNMRETFGSLETSNEVVGESLSGGTGLPSGNGVKTIMRSVSGNDLMWVGGTGANSPNSGKGFGLWGGESITLPVAPQNVRFYPRTSGNRASYVATV